MQNASADPLRPPPNRMKLNAFLRSVRAGSCLLGLALGAVLAPLPLRAEAPAADDPDRPARKILQRWIESIGGGQEIQALKSIVYECKIGYLENSPPIDLSVRATVDGKYRC